MSKLAILGGNPVRTEPFPRFNYIGEEERNAVLSVLDSGLLSKFLGCWDPEFYGGAKVQEFERAWEKYFGIKYAITVNSNTSGLYATIGAIGLQPGDEVIVAPYTMTASAACILGWGGVPVFADIHPETFCLDPKSVEEHITPLTKAILVVDLFGHPFDADAIMELGRRHQLVVIEDAAQAPLASYKGRLAGTLADIGIFSLNYHKHIHTGEGGVVVTNDDKLAERVQLIRNHGEAVVENKGVAEVGNIIGQNYRMTELEAAIGCEQLKKLANIIPPWQKNARQISKFMGQLPGITPPIEQVDCEHVYYVHASKWDAEITGVSRNHFVDAVKAELPVTKGRETEGALIYSGYTQPLYFQPLYQKRAHSCSFNCSRYKGSVSYERGICPVTEDMYFNRLITHELMRSQMRGQDVQSVCDAIEKVYRYRHELL